MSRQRNTHRRSMFFITFVLILMMGIGFVQVTSSYQKNMEKEAELAAIQEEIDMAKMRNVELNLTISEIGSRSFIEKMAREKFGLIYPNETLIDMGRE